MHYGVERVLQAVLNAVKGSLMMLTKRLAIQAAENMQMPQQPAFKVAICLSLHLLRL